MYYDMPTVYLLDPYNNPFRAKYFMWDGTYIGVTGHFEPKYVKFLKGLDPIKATIIPIGYDTLKYISPEFSIYKL